MALVFIFFLGIANFTLHKAVIESRHPLLSQMRWLATKRGQRIALGLEFTVLLSAMLLTANVWPQLAIAYAFYTGFNAITAWLILKGPN